LPDSAIYGEFAGGTASARVDAEEAQGVDMHWRFLATAISLAMCLAATHAEAAPRHPRHHARPHVRSEPVVEARPRSFFESFFEQLFSGGGGMEGGSGPIPRQLVSFPGQYKPGTIVISTKERRLYLVLNQGEALRYGIGVGRIGFTWRGVHHITAKREWPDWTPPPQMLRRLPKLPRHMHGGEDNPLGARAMYIGSTLYRIHGSNEPETIGHAVSSGCFRLTNEDVIDLYNRVRVGATVVVL
jgi:lipoprotein-anchoring transpeptidase ErfK/SrfK